MSCQQPRRTAHIDTTTTLMPNGELCICTGITVYRQTFVSILEQTHAENKAGLYAAIARNQTADVCAVLENVVKNTREALAQ